MTSIVSEDYVLTYHKLPRCGAYARSADRPCRHVALANGRCYYHGGKSTGPKTPRGRAICKKNKMTHGRYTKENIEERKAFRNNLKEIKVTLNKLLE